jgi:hypothetical protein
MTEERRLYGIVAEFDDPGPLVDAARILHEHGFRKMEAYTPYAIHELDEFIRGSRRLPLLVLIGGMLGTLTAWSMQFYIAVFDYPINVGGRPLNSWPSFIVIMFELTVLFASLTAFFGMLGLAGLPLPHHPMFEVPNFELASNNRFFLCVEARDPNFDAERVTDLLMETEPLEVREVEDT